VQFNQFPRIWGEFGSEYGTVEVCRCFRCSPLFLLWWRPLLMCSLT